MNGNIILRPNTPGRNGVSPRTRSLKNAWSSEVDKCLALQKQRAELEHRVADAIAKISECQTAYYTSLGVDEANIAEMARRKKEQS